jgi:outer membrane protein OmpA-like peptidoglycan-associated protein
MGELKPESKPERPMAERPMEEGSSSETDQAALKQLQALLISPEQAQLQPWVADLEQKLHQLQHQVLDPSELMGLMQPWIAELLSRKVTESKEEMVRALAPLIDRVIEDRVQQNKSAMSAAIAPVIASAIVYQTQQAPEDMAEAIAPTMGKAMKAQISQEQDAIVDALYPILGSMIAKYLAEALLTINQKLDSALSPEGIQRKIQAKIQGVSEAEILLQQAVPFTVEAVFLIHKASGLVIAEVQPQSHQLESEMISGMLTAIRSFANDCIGQSTSDLNEINYGDAKILLEVAGYSYLAVVVRGNPPRSFLQQVRALMETLVQKHSNAIEAYDGDPETVPEPIPQLLETLHPADSLGSSKKRPKPPLLLVIGLLLVGLVGIPWGILQYRDSLDRQVQAATASALAATPELAVYQLAVAAHHGTLTLTGRLPNPGLRQKAEQVARSVSPDWALHNTIVAVDVPPDPTLTLAEVQRTTATLNRIDGVTVSSRFESGKVTVAGSVGRATDGQTVTQAFERIPGVRSVATTFQVRSPQIEVRFYFPVGSAQVPLADLGYKLHQVVDALVRNPDQKVRLVGHSNPADSPNETQQLAVDRAIEVRDLLVKQGINLDRLQVSGTTDSPSGVGSGQPAWLSRCVAFELAPASPK